jgi:regulator of sigma E protease
MISLNLAALNALPIPALDGGRILFIVIEKLRGKTMNPKREIWANLICFGLLILLMLVITGRDIVRLF